MTKDAQGQILSGATAEAARLNDGQKLAYEIEAGRQPGKSSAVNLKAI